MHTYIHTSTHAYRHTYIPLSVPDDDDKVAACEGLVVLRPLFLATRTDDAGAANADDDDDADANDSDEDDANDDDADDDDKDDEDDNDDGGAAVADGRDAGAVIGGVNAPKTYGDWVVACTDASRKNEVSVPPPRRRHS
jgi:hypothetical protein